MIMTETGWYKTRLSNPPSKTILIINRSITPAMSGSVGRLNASPKFFPSRLMARGVQNTISKSNISIANIARNTTPRTTGIKAIQKISFARNKHPIAIKEIRIA
jgi:hypothetical protein